jgi:hypothetical protein
MAQMKARRIPATLIGAPDVVLCVLLLLLLLLLCCLCFFFVSLFQVGSRKNSLKFTPAFRHRRSRECLRPRSRKQLQPRTRLRTLRLPSTPRRRRRCSAVCCSGMI